MESTGGISAVSFSCEGPMLTYNMFGDGACKTTLMSIPYPYAAGSCNNGTKITCVSGTVDTVTNSMGGATASIPTASNTAAASSTAGASPNQKSNAFKNTFGLLGALMGLALL